MNMLFGTDFSVMIAKAGRKQTTLGVWIGLSPPDKDEQRDTDTVMVLDVEGTDSRERGEEHGAFERKTSLFSLALSEILIINMWTTDVGLHDGANYGLLKVVFELNLQLFQQSSNGNKTLLLFLFRDHTLPEDEEHTPLEYFVKVIREDMDKIWSGISKSENFANSKVTDFFDFEFVSLPHKVHKSKDFKHQVAHLKHRFLDPANPHRLLSKNYKKDIPADGFAKFATDVWALIQENKDLNIPTQKEMLSMFRCEQMANAAYDTLALEFAEFYKHLDQGELVQSFGSRLNTLIETAFEQYDDGAKRYVPSVAQSKRDELLDKIAHSAAKLLRLQLAIASKLEMAAFNEEIRSKITSQKGPLPNFGEILDKLTETTLDAFDARRQECAVLALKTVATYSTAPEDNEYRSSVNNRIQTLRKDQFQILMSAASKKFEKTLNSWIQTTIENGGSSDSTTSAPLPSYAEPSASSSSSSSSSSLSASSSSTPSSSSSNNVKVTPGLVKTWDEIQAKYEKEVAKFLDEMQTIMVQLRISADLMQQERAASQERCSEVLQKIFRDISNNVGWLMERRFASIFKFDANRIPRRWKPNDDLNGEFQKACLQAERLLDQVSVLRLLPDERGFSWLESQQGGVISVKADSDAVPEPLSIMTHNEVSRALEQFRDKARGDFIQASHAQETAVKGSYTVMVALVMFLIFGWDEAMYLITNPFALAVVSILGAAVFGAYHLGLFPIITPVVNTVVAVVSKALAGNLEQTPMEHVQHSSETKLRDAGTKLKTE